MERWRGAEGHGEGERKGMCVSKHIVLADYVPVKNEWVKQLWYIYTVEFYAAERKKELIPFPTAWMELESIMLSEISQAVRDKYHIISPISGS